MTGFQLIRLALVFNYRLALVSNWRDLTPSLLVWWDLACSLFVCLKHTKRDCTAYAIYMSVKKLSFYIDTAKITVKIDHLPLKKNLEKNTLNSKVNHWAVELESQNMTFKYIPGIQNTLADTLSRWIKTLDGWMDENIKLQPEDKGKEFGYFPFEELPPVTTQVVEEVIKCKIGNINIQHVDPVQVNTDITLPVKDEKLVKLQESDPHTQQLRKQWTSNNLDKNAYTMENNILK